MESMQYRLGKVRFFMAAIVEDLQVRLSKMIPTCPGFFTLKLLGSMTLCKITLKSNSDSLSFDQISANLRLKLSNGIVLDTSDYEDRGEQATRYSFALPYRSDEEFKQVFAQLPAIQNVRVVICSLYRRLMREQDLSLVQEKFPELLLQRLQNI
jgi:hypothetical protein